ncbi:MAG: bifunctional DNA-formamidopyrimidine glycosylase/DNA-(apurinic or apyrimidinic site) lyase [Candidatus Glassbacteria bacterium]
MPELPEVETIVRQLGPLLTGRRTRELKIYDRKLETGLKDVVPGRPVETVSRLGKQICLALGSNGSDRNPLWLVFHLRMTGRLIVDSERRGQNERHLRAELVLEDGSLLFYDLRRFGLLLVLRSLEEAAPLGIDPLSPRFTVSHLTELIGGSTTAIKPWLLRQDRIVGLGNIYASEILFASVIDPRTPACRLDHSRLTRLHRQTRHILRLAIENCGTTFSDFQDSHGRTGSFQNLLKVYDRQGEPCPRCRSAIERIVQQQRSTYFCPACQKSS